PARPVAHAVLDPELGEGLIVDVAPAARLLDGDLDGRLGVLALAEPVAHLALRARPVGEELDGGVGRPRALVDRRQLGGLLQGQPLATLQATADYLGRRQAKGELAVNVDRDPFRVALLVNNAGDLAGPRLARPARILPFAAHHVTGST